MDPKAYVEYLLKNYHSIQQEVEQLKFEVACFPELSPTETIEMLNFQKGEGDRVQTSDMTDKTAKIALIYSEVTTRLNDEARKEIENVIKVTEFELAKLHFSIEQLEPHLQQVIESLFFDRLTVYAVSREQSVAERTVQKYKQQAIDILASRFNLKRLVV